MTRWAPAALLLAAACGEEPAGKKPDRPVPKRKLDKRFADVAEAFARAVVAKDYEYFG